MLNFFMKGLLKAKLKSAGVKEADMERIFAAVEKNPDFFKNIASEVEKKTKEGMSQQDAVMAVMHAHQAEIKNVMGK